jgi:membrane-associated phospholipid phosphatase
MAFLRSAILCAFLSGSLCAAAGVPDSARHERFHHIRDTLSSYFAAPVVPKPLKWKAIVVPAGLITYGTLSVAYGWFNDINLFGRRWASNNEDPNQKTRLDDFTEYAPAVAVYGLNIAGIRGKHNWIDETFMYAVGLGIANTIVAPVKRWTAERRPDSSDALSFPSGHTATAFVAAEFLRQEYKDRSPWIGAGGYAIAVATGYLRMYNNKHWFSDVMAGAGVGIFSTRITYWAYPKLKNLILGKSPGSTAVLFMPTYSSGQPGFYMVYRF